MECRVFWFNGLLHWDFGVSSINGQLISEQLKEVFPATMELCILAFGFADGRHPGRDAGGRDA